MKAVKEIWSTKNIMLIYYEAGRTDKHVTVYFVTKVQLFCSNVMIIPVLNLFGM